MSALDTSVSLLQKDGPGGCAEVVMDAAAAAYLLSHIDRTRREGDSDEEVPIPSLPAETLPAATLSFDGWSSRFHEMRSRVASFGTLGPLDLIRFADPAAIPPDVTRRPVVLPPSLFGLHESGAVSILIEVGPEFLRSPFRLILREDHLRLVQARAALLSGDPTYLRFFEHRDGEKKVWRVCALVRSIAPERLAHLSAEGLGRVLPPLLAFGNERARDFATDVLALHRRQEGAARPNCCGDRPSLRVR